MSDTKPTLTLVGGSGGDWEGLYVDGVLECQGHSIRLCELAEALGLKLVQVEVNQAWLEKQGDLPDLLSAIPAKVMQR